MPEIEYRADPAGMRALGQSRGMQDAMVRAAETGRAWVEANAPRVSGAYAGSATVEPVTVTAGWRREPRAGARLEVQAPHASSVERSHQVLRRAIDVVREAL